MIRRCVNIAVMLGFLANQLAAVPHAHAEGSRHDHHSSQPHVHLSWFGRAYHDYEHHRHDGPAADHHHDHLLTHTTLGRGAADDHDDDAIYLSPVVATVSSGNDNHIGWLKWQTANVWQSVATASKPVIDIPSLAFRERPPDLAGEHCALFLKLQTLRI
jgi:hypothetical protein